MLKQIWQQERRNIFEVHHHLIQIYVERLSLTAGKFGNHWPVRFQSASVMSYF